MPMRRRRSLHPAVQAVEMAWAVPQVVAHRLARLSLAAPVPSARDRDEFLRMGAEKASAFQEAWSAVLVEMASAQWRWWTSAMLGSMPRSLGAASAQARHTALALLTRGTAPYHRRAVANARRLGRVPLR